MSASVVDTLQATYLIETPLDPRAVAEVLAGEQSSGTFVRVAGESDELRARSRATVDQVEELAHLDRPSLPSSWLQRQHPGGPWRRARVTVSFPLANIGANLPALAATVAGNLFDLGESTGLRLQHLRIPATWRARFEGPRQGVAGTRRLTGVAQGPLIGTIIKPNVGLSAAETAGLVARLCQAGVDFIKDDECCANPQHAPVDERICAVMDAVRRHRDATGKAVMVAFHISDEHDAMLRHAELVQREGGSCVMVSLNWVGLSSLQALRRHTDLALHGHRNGYGMWSRHPALGIDFQPYALLWRLAGIDHLHVHGLGGKFAQDDAEVVQSARDCLTPLCAPTPSGQAGAEGDAQADMPAPVGADRVMPAFSSGQWAGTLGPTLDALPSADLMFMCGGGILAHPMGAAAGVASVRQAWQAWRDGHSLQDAAAHQPALRAAIERFGPLRA